MGDIPKNLNHSQEQFIEQSLRFMIWEYMIQDTRFQIPDA